MRRVNLKREDGVAMTEFALIVPVFLLIVAGLLAFGRVFFYWIEANHMASETARWAVVDRNPYAGQTLQQHAAQNVHRRVRERREGLHRLPRQDPDDRRPRRPASASGSRSRSTSSPSSGMGPITIRGSSTMRIERLVEQRRPAQLLRHRDDDIGTCT